MDFIRGGRSGLHTRGLGFIRVGIDFMRLGVDLYERGGLHTAGGGGGVDLYKEGSAYLFCG